MLSTSHGLGISARARVQTALLYLRNGLADWVQFWCVSWGSWARCLPLVMGGGISARAHVHTALLYLRNGFTDCVQIWYVGWASLSTCFPQVRGGVGHLYTCARAPPSPYLKIRVTNCAKIWCVTGNPIVTRFTRVGGGVTAHSHVRLQFRCLGNRWALTLKPHQNKLTYLFRARSFIAKHDVLLVIMWCKTLCLRITNEPRRR